MTTFPASVTVLPDAPIEIDALLDCSVPFNVIADGPLELNPEM
jgi:hypothetical protein